MPSNYEPIGEHIRLVDVRNKDLKIERLVGLSITKQFIPSVANIIGTDMANYKIIKKGQFACSVMQVRRDGKMPVALMEEYDEAIISQAYPVFEVVDETKLLPEYLMMWFTRSEFDRHACFLAVGGVRGSLEWDDFLEMELPVPHIDVQRAMVKEYNTITNRIALNEKLNQKLEETAQAIYRQWFIDFEFPYDFEIGEPSLQGKPYKTNGGEMVWCEELEKDIPKGWEYSNIKAFAKKIKSGGTPNRGVSEYWNPPQIPWIKTGELRNKVIVEAEESISNEGSDNSAASVFPINSVLIAMYGQGNTKGQIGYLKIEASTNQACCAMTCDNEEKATYLYNHLRFNREEIVSIANGGAQPNLSKTIIEEVGIIIPQNGLLEITPFVKVLAHREALIREDIAMIKSKNLLLSKMSTAGENARLEPIKT